MAGQQKIRYSRFVAFFFILLFIAGCSKQAEPQKISSIDQLNDSRYVIGGMTGTASLKEGRNKLPKAQFIEINELADMLTALKAEKIDAVVYDRPPLEYASVSNNRLRILSENAGIGHIAIAAPFKNAELVTQVNEYLRQYKKDGTAREMYNRWINSKDPEMPDLRESEKAVETIMIGIDCQNPPMTFIGKDHQLNGFDVELSKRIAIFLNKKCELKIMDYKALFPAIQSGKIDLAVASLDKTPERSESMLFTDDYIDSPAAVMILDKNYKEPEKAVITSIKDLTGKRAASLTGSSFKVLTEPLADGIDYIFFNDNVSSVQALLSDKADAVLFDEPVAKLMAARFPGTQIACVYAQDNYGFAFRKGSPLCQRANSVIQKMKESGELDRLAQKWCGVDDPQKALENWTHNKNFTGKAGVLRFGVDPVMEPMVYIGPEGTPIGLDVELVRRIAYDLNMKFETVTMGFGSLIEALTAEKADVVGGAMSITDERKKQVDFSDIYYNGGLTVLSKKTKAKPVYGINEFSQLKGKKIGVLTGTTTDHLAKTHFPDSTPVYTNSFNDLVVSLKTGKIPAFLMEEPQARFLLPTMPDLDILKDQNSQQDRISFDDYAFVFSKKETDLCGQFSAEILKMKKNGLLASLQKKWFSGSENDRTLPILTKKSDRGTLKYAVVPQFEPFVYLQNGQITGYEIETAERAANELGYRLEPVIMDWGGYLEAIASGKVQMGIGCTTVTEERKKKVLFSEPTYQGGVAVIVMKGDEKAGSDHAQTNFLQNLKESFNRTFIKENRWKLILHGLEVTVIITVLAAVLGTALAFLVCFFRRSGNCFFRLPAKCFISLMQGMPMLVILMILYYIVFAKCDINAVLVATIGFALNFAAYAGEMMRTGVEGIDKGLIEAARALGLGKVTIFRKIIFPLAARRILPVYKGEFINMLKMTSIVGYIAIQDLTKMSDIIRSRTYEAFFPLIATAAIYFLVAHLLASFLTGLEFKLNPFNRRKTIKKGESVQ